MSGVKNPPFRVIPLADVHQRDSFSCGTEALDRYFRQQVTQDVRRRIAACFVAVDAIGTVAGYYTLASSSVLLTDLPVSIGKKLPRYPSVPAIRMGRLAVDAVFTGCGLGSALLADALDRAVSTEIAAFALVVDAKDATAAAFYLHHGFIALPAASLTLFLPLSVAKKLA
jgi:GNAT superfamily N-acetyltransferase